LIFILNDQLSNFNQYYNLLLSFQSTSYFNKTNFITKDSDLDLKQLKLKKNNFILQDQLNDLEITKNNIQIELNCVQKKLIETENTLKFQVNNEKTKNDDLSLELTARNSELATLNNQINELNT